MSKQFKIAAVIVSVLVFAWLVERAPARSADPFAGGGQGKVRLYRSELPGAGDAQDGHSNWLVRALVAAGLMEEDFVIPASTSLAVLVDDACLNQAPAPSRPGEILKIERAAPSKRSALQTHRIQLHKPIHLKQLRALAEANACIRGISHNHPANTGSVPPAEDPLQSNQIHLAAANALGPPSHFPEPVVVAVVDTGIDLSHDDLKENLWTNTIEAGGVPGVDDDQNGYVDDVHGYNFVSRTGNPAHEIVNDHGTHVAGLTGAVSANHVGGVGIARNFVRLMALNVFGKNWGTETVHIDEAIRYAADNGAKVINVSVGGPGHSDTTASAVTYAVSKGAFVVTAAGNLSQDVGESFYFPASYSERIEGLVSVSAFDARTLARCDFSNYGARDVEIAAPGCDQAAPKEGLLSTRAGGKFGHKKGTSMAAPLVSGAVALAYGILRDHGDDPLPSTLERRLLEGSTPLEGFVHFTKDGLKLNMERLQTTLDRK